MARLRFGLIGLGMAVTPHAKSLNDLADQVEVACAFSPSAERRANFATRFSFPLCDDVEAIFSDSSIGAIVILTPPNSHLELARRAAAVGKHILLEKPVSVSTATAVELVETCERAGVTLGVVLQHRFRPAGERLGQILGEGELGDIVGCSTVIRLWRPQAYYDEPGRGTKARDGGGVLLSQGIHTLDLMLSLAGPIVEVRGFATTTPIHRMETEDLVCAAVRFDNGAFGTIEATTAAFPGAAEHIELIGTKGTASLVGTALDVRLQDGRTIAIEPDQSAGGTGADPMAFPHDYHRAVMADFVDAVRSGRSPRVSGREALKVHRLIDALLQAGASGETVQVAT